MKRYDDDCSIIQRHLKGDKMAAYDLWQKYEPLRQKYWSNYHRRIRGMDKDDFDQEMYIRCVALLDWCKSDKIGPGYVLQNFLAQRAWAIFHEQKKEVPTFSLDISNNEDGSTIMEEIAKEYIDRSSFIMEKILPEVYKIADVKTRDVVLGILHGKGTREQSRDFAAIGIKISYARLHQRYMRMKDWLYNLMKSNIEEANIVCN